MAVSAGATVVADAAVAAATTSCSSYLLWSAAADAISATSYPGYLFSAAAVAKKKTNATTTAVANNPVACKTHLRKNAPFFNGAFGVWKFQMESNYNLLFIIFHRRM